MSFSSHTHASISISKLSLPVVCATAQSIIVLTTNGEIKQINANSFSSIVGSDIPLVCHAPYIAQRLKQKNLRAADILELYAFVYPTKFCVPTIQGLAKSIGLDAAESSDDLPLLMLESVDVLLQSLGTHKHQEKIVTLASMMTGWFWTPYILSACGAKAEQNESTKRNFNVWRDLPEWDDEPNYAQENHHPISAEDARNRLKAILQNDSRAESRAAQLNYATRIADMFEPISEQGEPHVLLAEAGTGVGKTLGYLVPASLWSEKNDNPVWISTFTRNLQRQIEQEMHRIYPDETLRKTKVAIRKGRENYLCLLNFEESAAASLTARNLSAPIAAGLMARWIMETKDGDLTGTDFHGWIPGLIGYNFTTNLADRRGECIFSACDHYKRCFNERAVRRAAHAPLVIANHAVVMIQTALASVTDNLPRRYIFDEGHHLFTAADSAFAAHLTGEEGYDLRRWIIGPEGTRRSRARGLKKRLEDVLSGDETGLKLLSQAIHQANILPREEWLATLTGAHDANSFEKFIFTVYQQILARTNEEESFYASETNVFPLTQNVSTQAKILYDDLIKLKKPLNNLILHLRDRMDMEADIMSTETRKRMDAVTQSLERRVNGHLSPWISMLESLESGMASEGMIDWMAIEKNDGRLSDVGFYRHYHDPMIPFAQTLKPHAHAVAITSATLRDQTDQDDPHHGWDTARILSGADNLSHNITECSIPSPFDYTASTRIFIVTDVRKNDADQLATAYRELFLNSGGGALGLFTAINRLRSVHEKINDPLAKAGISLLAQHIDRIDTGTLVDMFRDDINSCLLGTDAVRDGVDVPGESLRLIVFDRVPWPRASILHKARRDSFGGSKYDDRLTRLKLKQAYGRLIRKADDKGVFVMLDSSLPSRLLTAFPAGVLIERIGLSEVIKKTKEFLEN